MKMFTIYTCEGYNSSYDVIMAFLHDEGLSYAIEFDQTKVMRLTCGKVNPINGFVLESHDGTIIQNIYELCNYISKRGLRRI